MPLDDLPKSPDSLSLASWLIKQNTITPGSNETALLKAVGALLEQHGFTVAYDFYDEQDPGRCSLSAHLHPECASKALLLGGHIDTVPLGTGKWDFDPFCGEVQGGKLLGRGSCDMKSGAACILRAALEYAERIKDRDLIIQLFGGEENSCKGSFHLAKNLEHFKNAAACIIAEPTGAYPLLGHRGALWLKLSTAGKTAHCAMPERGDNALTKLLPAANRLIGFGFELSHPDLGKPTVVLSTLHSGLNINSVPDQASLTLDIRTLPSQDSQAITEQVTKIAGPEVKTEILEDVGAIWTDSGDPFVRTVYEAYEKETGAQPRPGAVSFFTDGSAVKKALPQLPVVILGPGDTAQAHQLNEACDIRQIELCDRLYDRVIKAFYGL